MREVEDVWLAESKDDESTPVFWVEIVLRDGSAVPASLLWTHGRGALGATARFLELQQPTGT